MVFNELGWPSMSTVTLTIPAQTDQVALVRSAAASLAAHAGFTIDRIDDIRLAIDEAAALCIASAAAGASVRVDMELLSGALELRVGVRTEKREPPRKNTFAWTVLTALVDTVQVDLIGGMLLITLQVKA